MATPNKYGTRVAGKRSSLEAVIQVLLDSAQIPAKYEQKKIEYVDKGTYNPDWYVDKIGPYKDIIIEAKGNFSSSDRRKMKLVRQQHPNLTIIMVFGKELNRLNRKSTTTYADWCERYEILHCDVKDLQSDPRKTILELLKNKNNNKRKGKRENSVR